MGQEDIPATRPDASGWVDVTHIIAGGSAPSIEKTQVVEDQIDKGTDNEARSLTVGQGPAEAAADVTAKATEIATGRIDGLSDSGEQRAENEASVEGLDGLIDYFGDTKNNMKPDPDRIRQAGTIIAKYFDRAAKGESADEEFEDNLDSIISAASAIMRRYVGINGVQSRDPAIVEAQAIEKIAFDTATRSDIMKGDLVDLILDKNPADGLGSTRTLTRMVMATQNPAQVRRLAEIGRRSATLLASVAEAGAQNRAMDLNRAADPITGTPDEFHNVAYKDYIAHQLSETLSSIKDSNLLVA